MAYTSLFYTADIALEFMKKKKKTQGFVLYDLCEI